MEAIVLLARAAAAGYRIEAEEGDLLVSGPRTGHESIIAELRAAKSDVIAALYAKTADEGHSPVGPADSLQQAEPFTEPASKGCRCCGGTAFWRLRDACPWVCARCHPCDDAAAVEVTHA